MSSTSAAARPPTGASMENLLHEVVGFGTLISECELHGVFLPDASALIKGLTVEGYHAFMALCPDDELAEVFAEALAVVLAGTLKAAAVPDG